MISILDRHQDTLGLRSENIESVRKLGASDSEVTINGKTFRCETSVASIISAINAERDALQSLGVALSLVTITATYTVGENDYTILANAASGAITVNLPPASNRKHRILVIKKIDATNNVTIEPDGSETLDGSTNKVISTQYQSRIIQSDGTNWHILGQI